MFVVLLPHTHSVKITPFRKKKGRQSLYYRRDEPQRLEKDSRTVPSKTQKNPAEGDGGGVATEGETDGPTSTTVFKVGIGARAGADETEVWVSRTAFSF